MSQDTDNGIPNAFLKSIDGELRPGTSALVLYGRSNPGQRPELVRRLATFNPKILESDLPADLEQAFNESLERAERAPRVVG